MPDARSTTVGARIGQVFDRRAETYDAVAESALGRELRGRVHVVLADLVTPLAAVADLGCGSGLDAYWLAGRVGSVAAFDSSPEMVAAARRRCAHLANVTVTEADIARLELREPVDLALANFGVVNCVDDLAAFGSRLATMVKPKGHAVLVTMARWCPIEVGIALATRNRDLRRRRGRRRAATAGYEGLDVRYASANTLAAALGNRFDVVHAESLGLVLPPFEQRRWVQDRPRLLRSLAAADRRTGRVGARLGLGDHHIAVLKRTSRR